MRFESNFQDEYIRSNIFGMSGDGCYCFLLMLFQLPFPQKKVSNKNILIENGGDAQGHHEWHTTFLNYRAYALDVKMVFGA